MLSIQSFSKTDISIIVDSFSKYYSKPVSTFEEYFCEQERGERFVWLAYLDNEFAGYVTLKLKSLYKSFIDKSILEINDLNVLPTYRKQGIASKLLDIAEEEAKNYSDIVGLGVGLHSSYGAAQKLYAKRGYIPDGFGITYKDRRVEFYESVILNDDLLIWLIKKF